MDLEAAAKETYAALGYLDWENQNSDIKEQWYKKAYTTLKTHLKDQLSVLETQFSSRQRRNAVPVKDNWPELDIFLSLMKGVMDHHALDKGRRWQHDSPDILSRRVVEEAAELNSAAHDSDKISTDVIDEALDVALMAFMVAERTDPQLFQKVTR